MSIPAIDYQEGVLSLTGGSEWLPNMTTADQQVLLGMAQMPAGAGRSLDLLRIAADGLPGQSTGYVPSTGRWEVDPTTILRIGWDPDGLRLISASDGLVRFKGIAPSGMSYAPSGQQVVAGGDPLVSIQTSGLAWLFPDAGALPDPQTVWSDWFAMPWMHQTLLSIVHDSGRLLRGLDFASIPGFLLFRQHPLDLFPLGYFHGVELKASTCPAMLASGDEVGSMGQAAMLQLRRSEPTLDRLRTALHTLLGVTMSPSAGAIVAVETAGDGYRYLLDADDFIAPLPHEPLAVGTVLSAGQAIDAPFVLYGNDGETRWWSALDFRGGLSLDTILPFQGLSVRADGLRVEAWEDDDELRLTIYPAGEADVVTAYAAHQLAVQRLKTAPADLFAACGLVTTVAELMSEFPVAPNRDVRFIDGVQFILRTCLGSSAILCEFKTTDADTQQRIRSFLDERRPTTGCLLYLDPYIPPA